MGTKNAAVPIKDERKLFDEEHDGAKYGGSTDMFGGTLETGRGVQAGGHEERYRVNRGGREVHREHLQGRYLDDDGIPGGTSQEGLSSCI